MIPSVGIIPWFLLSFAPYLPFFQITLILRILLAFGIHRMDGIPSISPILAILSIGDKMEPSTHQIFKAIQSIAFPIRIRKAFFELHNIFTISENIIQWNGNAVCISDGYFWALESTKWTAATICNTRNEVCFRIAGTFNSFCAAHSDQHQKCFTGNDERYHGTKAVSAVQRSMYNHDMPPIRSI